MKKILLILSTVLFVCSLSLFVSAEEEGMSLALSQHQAGLTDGNEKKSYSVKDELTITSEEPMDSLYLIFFEEAADFTLVSEGEEKAFSASFLRQYISISQLFGEAKGEVTLRFSSAVDLMEIYGFAGEAPSWVQIWEAPCEKADLALMTTHADDEQLFFAGVLPYYAGEKDLAVQVIYFTDHVNEPLRRHELLRGLWTVGVENYPVIASFPDLYSKSGEVAENQLNSRGISREDIVSFQVEMLRRFRPLVVIGHDPLGEYGHGQHILNSATLQEAVLCSASSDAFPESAERYGLWDVPKTYLHLYGENQITMDWDIPLESFDGKTAFEMTKEGFLCHDSQQYTWFRRWLNGNNGEITKASQIRTYSPCSYGLFRSLVGEDVSKNDFFENQMTYEEIRIREEEERLRLEAEEKARLEEEARLAEEKRKAEEVEKRRMEEEKRQAQKEKQILTIAIVIGVFAVLFEVLMVVFRIRKKKKGDSDGIIMK